MKNLARIAIVFVGLTALTRVPERLWDIAGMLQGSDSYGQRGWMAIAVLTMSVLLLAILGMTLVALSDRLASRWFADDESLALNIEPTELLHVALLVFGYVTVAYAITGFIATIGFALASVAEANANGFDMGGLGSFLQLSGPIGQLVVGIITIALARPLSHRFGSSKAPAGATVPMAAKPQATCPNCDTAYDPDDYSPGVTHRCSNCHEVLGDASNNGFESDSRGQ